MECFYDSVPTWKRIIIEKSITVEKVNNEIQTFDDSIMKSVRSSNRTDQLMINKYSSDSIRNECLVYVIISLRQRKPGFICFIFYYCFRK